MKSILIIILSFLLVVSGFCQTRNVVVGTNGAVVQPTNFWSADITNARSGLGLGTAATNPESAFQPSSIVLSNLANSNGGNLTNITISNVIGLLATNGSAAGLTNFPASLLVTNGNGAGLTNLTAANITGTVGLASNITGTIAITNGGTGATNADGARTNLGLGSTNDVRFKSVILQDVGGISNNITYGGEGLEFYTDGNLFLATEGGYGVTFYRPLYFPTNTNSASITRTNLELGASWLTNTNAANFRTNIGLGLSALTNTNTVNFRSDIGLGLTALTNTNVSNFRSSIGLGLEALTNTNNSNFLASFFGSSTNPVLVNSNGTVVSPTNLWDVAPIQTLVQNFTPVANATNAATNARTLYVYSLALSTTGVTNVVTLPTNTATKNGDEVTVIHMGPTSSITAIRQLGQTNNLITINKTDEAVKFIYENSAWTNFHNIGFVEPIQFSGTNAAVNAAASRTNLGLGQTDNVQFNEISGQIITLYGGVGIVFDDSEALAPTRTNLGIPLAALTNTSNATFQQAIFATNAAPTNAGTFGDYVAWMGVSIVTNGVTNTFKIPLYK